MADLQLFNLTKLFTDTIHGRRDLKNAREGRLFIKGLCANSDHVTCVHRIITSAKGLSSIQASMRFDTSLKFLNGEGLDLLRYVQDPSIAPIDSGSVLASILKSALDPPFFLDALRKGFVDGSLLPDSRHAFAWLLLQMITLAQLTSPSYVALAKSPDILDSILKSTDGATRILGEKIKHALPQELLENYEDSMEQPGGRHDNDHVDYRLISVMPTVDELLSKDRPFLRTPDYLEDEYLASSRGTIHLDNQFRMLREDMLSKIGYEVNVLTKNPGIHKGDILNVLRVSGIETGIENKRQPWAIVFEVEIPQVNNVRPNQRTSYLKDNQHILRHGSIVCLLLGDEPVAFPTVHRDVDQLAKQPSVATFKFSDDSTLSHALQRLKSADKICMAQLDTALFSYEPFLTRLQAMPRIPLGDELLHWGKGNPVEGPEFQPKAIIQSLESNVGKELKEILGAAKSVKLDQSQMEALIGSLSQRISLVQGPPGTGKSFIGALSAKAIHDHTDQAILVICYTNHALDQFLEDLLDIGIPQNVMVRLGAKSTDRTKPLAMREQGNAKLSSSHWRQINELEAKIKSHETRLKDGFKRYQATIFGKQQIMDFLELLFDDDRPYFDAFSLPDDDEQGMTRVGRKGKKMDRFYLLDRWISGETDAGSIQHLQRPGTAVVWKMSPTERSLAQLEWKDAIIQDQIREIEMCGRGFNENQKELAAVFGQRAEMVVRSKRIIGCTTTGAAMYASAIQSAHPGVVLVEEAGEILEAHVLTALGPDTQQLILIGDHKQLRPSCSFNLSVEQGNGFDLNRSLFERLVLAGFPHSVLSKQHRMRPEISSIIRHLTYPELTDAESTHNRPNLRGFRDNIIWLNHGYAEGSLEGAQELWDEMISSNHNKYEARMVLKTMKYLARQSYGSENLVVLTPCLGQLKLLSEELSKENDPVLSDIDRCDLVKAGLLTNVSSKKTGCSLRISTIDNYQGEESEIVLVSMTRSNTSYDIGFMQSPERLNVLLSRARNGLIMIGNAETFMNARKGKELWCKLFDHLKEHDHVYEGLPVKCEKHPDRIALLSSPDDFEMFCPDGGSSCNTMLKCNIHKCHQKAALAQKAEEDATTTMNSLRASQDKLEAEIHDLHRKQEQAQSRHLEEEVEALHKEEAKSRADSLELLRNRKLAKIQELKVRAENERRRDELRCGLQIDQVDWCV